MTTTEIDWQKWKTRLIEAGFVLLRFAKNPRQGMITLPDWDWPFLLVCQAIAAAASGLVSAIVRRDLLGFFIAPIFTPITSLVLTGFFAGVLFYLSDLWFQKPAHYHKLFTIVVFGSLPSMAISPVSSLFPPFQILGSAATLFLIYIAMTEVLNWDTKKSKQFIGALAVFHILIWAFNTSNLQKHSEAIRDRATPESLDILEKETSKGL